MKFCQSHWDALKGAIESRGLGHLIAANGRDAHARAVAELTGRAELADFDPLLAAHKRITSTCLDWCGISLLMRAKDGDHLCPLCETLKTYPPIPEGHRYKSNESYFIDGPADAILAACEEWGIARPTLNTGDSTHEQ